MTTGATTARVSVRIREVPATAGLRWIRLALRAFGRQPGGFMGLFGMFLLFVFLLSLPLAVIAAAGESAGMSPLAFAPFSLVAMPLLTLSFMLGTEAVSNDLRIRPGLLFAPLRTSAATRRSLLAIGLVYVATLFLAYFFGNFLDDGAVRAWIDHRLMPADPMAPPEPLPEAAGAGLVLVLKAAVVSLASIPLWHAPPLVLWGGQRAWPAMFASTIALWRTRAAFGVFLGGWFALGMGVSALLTLVALLLPGSMAAVAISLGVSWAMSALFYVTLWFGFQDTFDVVATGPDVPRRAS